MTEPASRRRTPWILAAAALAGLAAGAAGVYVSGLSGANESDRCAAAGDRAAALKPFATGEIAALLPADRPQDLSSITVQTVDGAPHALSAHAGKVVLLNLWATWCGPCRAEMPSLDRLQAAKGGPDFEVVTVNIDVGDPEKPRAFLEEIGIAHLPDLRDPRMGIFNALKTRGLAFGLPTTLVLDRQGCQVAALHGPAEWDSAEALALVDAAVARR